MLDMQVNRYTMTGVRRDGAPPPRVWRIATDEGVFWLAEDAGRSRLIALPMPVGDEGGGTPQDDTGRAPWEALAIAAETEAATRWVSKGSAHPERRGVERHT